MRSCRLIIVISALLLTGCKSAYLAELNINGTITDYSVLVPDFEAVCSIVDPESSLFELIGSPWAKDYEKVTACGRKDISTQTLFFLVSSKDSFNSYNYSVLWGVPASHFGTSIGNYSFPKWYCDDYFEIYRAWNTKHDIVHDKKLAKKCGEQK